jgi:UDP-glucose 4-epimerase
VRALVTGGAGFIGSNLVDALLARGDQVVVLDDLSTGKRENVDAAAQLVEGSILDDALGEAVREARPEVCFHLAAQADVPTSVARPDFDAEVNVVGTVRVLAAAGGAAVVFTSTGGAIYGECDRPAREDDPRRPLSPYGVAKLAGEEYLAGWNRLQGTRHAALRLANVYGPRQEAGLEGGVVAIFLDAMAAGEETKIYGDGRQTRDFVHVDDVVGALLGAVGAGAVFNVGSGVETSVLELHERCRAVAGDPREPVLERARSGDVVRSVLDASLAARELGWRPQVSLDDGLRRTWEWVRSRSGEGGRVGGTK